jgi:hypothetical protein
LKRIRDWDMISRSPTKCFKANRGALLATQPNVRLGTWSSEVTKPSVCPETSWVLQALAKGFFDCISTIWARISGLADERHGSGIPPSLARSLDFSNTQTDLPRHLIQDSRPSPSPHTPRAFQSFSFSSNTAQIR